MAQQFEVVEVPTQAVAVVRRVVPMAGLTAFFEEVFGAVAGGVAEAGGMIVGPPFGWYFGMPGETVDVAAGFPAEGVVGAPGGEVVVQERPGGQAVVGMHVGPYDAMTATYAALQAWMAERSLAGRDDMWEEYLSPPEGDPATWQTRIVWPLR
ncbi:AraC family transcriptional regulator [bacterium]|nr:AraC family transcriptional regulator [Chloroflexi bacterium CFX6]RIL08888.1 MAG: AraC family transcriptional regulator [bacterium]